MKVKKIILTMVSTLILCAIAFSQTAYAATQEIPETPVYFASLITGQNNYDTDYSEGAQYSIGDANQPSGFALINKIGLVRNPAESNHYERLYDAYCARAQQGFETRNNNGVYDENDLKYTNNNTYIDNIDQYKTRYELVENNQNLINWTNTSCNWNNNYEKILQLTNLFFIGDDYESYKNTVLKDALVGKGIFVEEIYSQVEDSDLLTADQVRAIQQAALWYFTNSNDEDGLYNNNDLELYYKEDNNVYKKLNEIIIDDNLNMENEANALYKYLIETAESRAESGYERDSVVYLYTDLTQANTQPIIIIERDNREFDLALRKYISSVTTNETTTTYNEAGERMPNVDSTDLEAGEDTTAIYKHRKDPVVVEKGSKVNYRLVIYNEGEIDGRATKVVDQLPSGLKFLRVVSGNFESDGTYTTNNNKLTLVRKSGNTTNLPAYTTGTPANEVIEIECEVTADPDSTNRKILTNIAWIAEDYNDRGIADRDSVQTQPLTTLPNLVTTDIGYTGKDTYTEEQLRNENNYFKGQEDDDDFEKIVLLPKKFDLALRKFVTSINGEDINRIPTLTGNTIVEDTTAEKRHSKTPIQVAKGDIVIYTIRIYNEGDIAGTASIVTDFLPDGLDYVTDSTTNTNNGWIYDSATRKITTDILAGETIEPVGKNWEHLDDLDSNNNPIYYRDIKVECKVNASATNNNLKNVAEITSDTGNDVDSTPNENTPSPEDYGTPSTSPNGRGYEDDDDYENLKLVELDLALRKFITRVADNADMTGATEYNRAPVPTDLDKLYNDENVTTATYNHTKQPLKVKAGDYVEYTLRVFNEGSMDAYAREITDHLPEYLEYVHCEQNDTTYKWVVSEDGRTVKTEYLKDTKLNALNAVFMAGGLGTDMTSYYLDSTSKLQANELKIICKVKDNVPLEKYQTNIAEISKYGDKDNTPLDVDRDSKTPEGNGGVVLPEDLPNYKQDEIDSGKSYIPGQQDDDDFEKVYVPNFDLALRKFITKVEKVNEDNTRKDRYTKADYDARVPQISQESYENLINGRTTTLKYSHSKEPMDTVKNDIVTYTIRVYNEGSIDGYASVITDDIPEGVEFLPEDPTNVTYRWKMFAELPEGATAEAGREMVELNINEDSEIKRYVETTDVSKAKIIRTDYLSRENGARENLIKALDTKNGLSDTNPDYRDVQVAFKVTEDYGSDRIIINYAQISKDDNDYDIPDRDSTPDKWIKDEDDQDIEKIKVPQFDLALRKWVTQAIVTENGQTTVTETGHQPFDDPEEVVKVELHRKKLSNVTVKFRYSIRVYNDGYNKETGEALPGYIAGYAKEVKDHIPEGLKFLPEDNPDWKDEGNNIITTRKLENTLLKQGEFADVEVVLTWINGNDNLGLKINYAEISEDYNDWGVPDKDSTPDNMKEKHEDDDDEAPVILSVSTGVETTYFILGLTVLITIAGGVALIKKYVM